MDESTVETTGANVETAEEYVEQPEVQEAANEGGEEVEAESTEEQPAKPARDGGDHLDYEGRIRQEIGRRKELEARLNQLESSFKQTAQPDYIPITPQVQQQINNTLASIEQQRIDAELEGDYLRAAQHRSQFDQILRGLAENEQRMQRAQMTAQQQQAEQAKVKAINERAEFFRQANNIPPDQWQMANQWFADQVAQNPTLGVQFREIADYQGPMAAVDWAVKYVDQNLGRAVREANKAKEAAKVKLPGGTQQNVGQNLNNVKELKARAMQSRSSDDWANYFAAKRQLTSR